MTDPFTTWSRLLATGVTMQQTWWRIGETWQASGTVIEARTARIGAAARSPLQADLPELSRMIPEKLDAFGRSGGNVLTVLIGMQAAYWGQLLRIGTMLASGRMAMPGELSRLASSNDSYALGALDAGARLGKVAIAPIHRTVTGNARRLGRRTRKSQ